MPNEIPYSAIWLAIAVILGIIEASTFNLMTIWFAAGALFAMIAALIGIPVYYQVVVFIVISGLLLYFTKPFIKKFLKIKPERTNADRVIGETGVVIEKINSRNGTGKVKVGGQIWSARSPDEAEIAVDEIVRIQDISGVKLIVKKA